MSTLSSQDVRRRVLALRDELLENLEMIREAIREDRDRMTKYFKRFKDFRYRPVTSRDGQGEPLEYGEPTEIVMEPLATQFRTTVKSLIDSIRVIESEILPDDDPEGKDSAGTGAEAAERRAALRAGFLKSQNETAEAPQPIDAEAEPVQPKPAKSWRETVPGKNDTPKALTPAPTSVVGEAKPEAPKNETKPRTAIGLSPALRAQLQATVGASSMESIRAKYAKNKGSKDDAD